MWPLLGTSDRYFLAFVLVNVAQGGSSLLIPLFVTGYLGGDVGEVGLVTGLASLAGVPASIMWGRLSDRLRRRKPFVLIGLFGVAGSLAAMGLARSVPQMILLNALLNVTWLASAAVATLLAIEGLPRERWEPRIGRFNRYGGLGWVAGLLVGSLWMRWVTEPLGEQTMTYLFLLLGALALCGALLALAWIEEPQAKIEGRRFAGIPLAAGNLWERFKFAPFQVYHIVTNPALTWRALRAANSLGPALTRYFFSVMLYFIGFTACFIPLPIYFKDQLGLSGSLVFMLFMVHSGTSAFMNVRAGRLAARFGSRRLQLIFLAVRAVIFPAVGLLSLLAGRIELLALAIAIFFLLTGTSWAFINVCAIAQISKMAPEGYRGQALGMYNALAGAGAIVGSLLGGAVASANYIADFIMASAFVSAGLVMVWRSAPRSI